MSRDRLLTIAVRVVQAGRVLNIAAVVMFVAVLGISFVVDARLAARLAAKYPSADPAEIIAYLRIMLLFAFPVAFVVERLLRALRAILATVEAGDPFAAGNTGRLATIGWMLLALQLIDLVYGAATFYAGRFGVEIAEWAPSFTGWFGVLVAFVLVRVFAAGTAMRDDLAGTV